VPVTVTELPVPPELGVNVIFGLTVKVAAGLFVPSLKTTDLSPENEAGTVNVAVKPPLLSVVEELKVRKPAPANTATESLWLASMPVAVKVTVSPTFPEAGLKVILGLTVKVAEGELVPSLKTTVLLPEVEAGTVKVAVKPPLLSVPEVLKVTEVPPKVAVHEWLADRPVPVKVTVVPTLPEVGFKVILELTV
jgi:hypothetical protein